VILPTSCTAGGRYDECGSTAVVAFVNVDELEARDLYLANAGDAQAFLVAEVALLSCNLLPICTFG
jgi:hypothetical protein